MKNNILIILGMHRSGTSLTAQWLSACGLNLGERLLEKDFSNSKGHFEDLDFLELHKQVLTDNRLHDSGLNGNLENIKISSYFKFKIKHLCQLKRELNQQFGWKDPRTVMFVNEYKLLFPEAKYLIVLRDLSEVRTSLIKREIEKMKTQLRKSSLINKLKSIIFWKKYERKWFSILNTQYLEKNIFYHNQILNFLQNTNNNDYVVIKTNELNKKDKTLHKIFEQWGFTLNKIPFNKIFKSELYNDRNKRLEEYKEMTDKELKLFKAIEKYTI